MPNPFSRQTLEKFEAASASIPLRQLDRAFEEAKIRLGKDPGGPDGTRRIQFRRYVASVDQSDPQQQERLGQALGALIAAVAASKEEFLVRAAESDGFVFADGVFRPAKTTRDAFAATRVEDFALLGDRERRLRLLADERPADAIAGAEEMVASVCRTVLRALGEPAPGTAADLPEIAKAALAALDLVPLRLERLGAVVADLAAMRSGRLAPRHARLAIGSAVAFAGFVAESYAERAAS